MTIEATQDEFDVVAVSRPFEGTIVRIRVNNIEHSVKYVLASTLGSNPPYYLKQVLQNCNTESLKDALLILIEKAGRADIEASIGTLSQQLEEMEQMYEAVRNKRQEYDQMFLNFAQKSQELYHLLSEVMKKINEMHSFVTRNLL
jgi:uncharacterized protein YukE